MKYRAAALAALFVFAGSCTQAGQGATQKADATTSLSRAPAAAEAIAPASTAEAPPMENGAYVSHQLCGSGENSCPWKNWRASEAAAVYERPDPDVAVVANLAPGDWVEAIEGLNRFVPRRGSVRVANQGLEVGDVIYVIDSDGEGGQTIWRRGEELDWQSPDDQEEDARLIQWDPQPANDAPTLGWWVRVKLANGKMGWVHNGHFECMSPIEGSENCRG